MHHMYQQIKLRWGSDTLLPYPYKPNNGCRGDSLWSICRHVSTLGIIFCLSKLLCSKLQSLFFHTLGSHHYLEGWEGYKILRLRWQEFYTPPNRNARNSLPLPSEVTGILYPSQRSQEFYIPPRGHGNSIPLPLIHGTTPPIIAFRNLVPLSYTTEIHLFYKLK